jgi:hypothetical protein
MVVSALFNAIVEVCEKPLCNVSPLEGLNETALVGVDALIDENIPLPPSASVAVPSESVCTELPSSAITAVDPPVKLAGVFAEMVADQEVNALVEAEPLEELLLPPPAHALITMGNNTKEIFFMKYPLLFFYL